MTKKPQAKPRKREPKDARLILAEDPKTAPDKLLRPGRGPAAGRSNRQRAIRAEFDAAHQQGMEALREGDLDALGDGIKRERKAIDEQASMFKTQVETRTPRRKNR